MKQRYARGYRNFPNFYVNLIKPLEVAKWQLTKRYWLLITRTILWPIKACWRAVRPGKCSTRTSSLWQTVLKTITRGSFYQQMSTPQTTRTTPKRNCFHRTMCAALGEENFTAMLRGGLTTTKTMKKCICTTRHGTAPLRARTWTFGCGNATLTPFIWQESAPIFVCCTPQ